MGVVSSKPELTPNITDPGSYTIVEDTTTGCADDSLLEKLTVIANLESCKDEALSRAPNVTAYQYYKSGLLCYLYDESCFSGSRTKEKPPDGLDDDRGTLNIIYQATPSYLQVMKENDFEASLAELMVNTSMPTPGLLFMLADTDKNQLLTAKELEGLASTLGNSAESGFTLKGAFLDDIEIQNLMDTYFDCRAPDDELDFGEVFDALMDTTENCHKTGATDYFVDNNGRVPSTTMAHVKYTRDQVLYGFIGIVPPDCPSYGQPALPPSPPPAPCQPFQDSFIATRECGPFEESYNVNAQGDPTVIEIVQVDTNLTAAEQYTYCLEKCCDQKFNKVYGPIECEGVFYSWLTGKCRLYDGNFTISPGTDNAGEVYTATAKMLPKYTPWWNRRALTGVAQGSEDEGDEEEDEDDGSVELDEPRWGTGIVTELSGLASHRAMLEAEPSFPTLAPAPAAMPAAVLNAGLALAPLVALLLGTLVGRSHRAGRTENAGAIQL